MRTLFVSAALLSLAAPASALDCSRMSPERYGHLAASPHHRIEAVTGRMDGAPAVIVRTWTGGGFYTYRAETPPEGLSWRPATEADLNRISCR